MEVPQPIILMFLLAAAVWAVIIALRMSVVSGCLVALGASCCFGVSFASFDVGPATLSIDRLTLVVVVGLAVLQRFLTPQPRIQFDRCDLALAMLLLVLAASVWILDAPPKKSERTPNPPYLFALSFLAPAFIYWIIRFRTHSDRELRTICMFFVVFGCYLGFTAVCEVHHLSAFVFPKYILKERALYVGRAAGPVQSSPSLGTWLSVATVAGFLLWKQMRGPARWLLFSVFPLFAYAQYLTQTRSAWMGFVVAVPLAAYLANGRLIRQLMSVLLVIGVLAMALFVGEEFLLPSRVEGRAVVANSTDQRLGLLQRSITLFAQRPVLGWGFAQFEHVSTLHGGGGPLQIVPADSAQGLASHNILLRFIAELGLVGTIPFVAIFTIWLRRACHAIRSRDTEASERTMSILFLAAFIAYFCEAMFHDVTFIRQDNMLVYFLAGYIPTPNCSTADAAQPSCSTPSTASPLVRWRWAGGTPSPATPA